MKKTKLIISTLMVLGLITTTTADEKIVKGTTMGKYQKPGAPINITHISKRVALNEISDVNITLTTPLSSGEMEVELNIDKKLYTVDDNAPKKLTFSLSPDIKEYKINLQVFSDKDGLYYIRLSGKIVSDDGVRIRAMAVPVYVGDGELKVKRKSIIMKAVGGENLSISKAEESFEVIK